MKKIDGTRGSFVSANGVVWSTFHGTNKRPKPVQRTLFKNKGGYPILGLWINGKLTTCMVHRLVAEAFCEKPQNHVGRLVVNHKNGIKTDNRAENLEWTNDTGSARHKLRVMGVNPTSKISNTQAMDLIFLKQTSVLSDDTLFKNYNISKGHARLIERKVWREWIWSEVTPPSRGAVYARWFDRFKGAPGKPTKPRVTSNGLSLQSRQDRKV